jgi:hypothetical protein
MAEWRKNLWLTKDEAKEAGMTHEGTLYGIPVYLGDTDNPEAFLAVPKIPLLVLWTLFCNSAFEFFAMFCPDSVEIRVPVTFGDKL